MEDVKISAYDEYRLLLHAQGRCVQDAYCIVPIKIDELPEEIIRRQRRRIDAIKILDGHALEARFKDGSLRRVCLEALTEGNPWLKALAAHRDLFGKAGVQEDGFAVKWGDLEIGYLELYQKGVVLKEPGGAPVKVGGRLR